jgi:hypothetical protein
LITLNWKLGLPPAFAQNAVRRFSVQEASQLGLEAELTGAFPPTVYQWLRNGIAIASATNATLLLDPVEKGHAGTYSLVALNEFGAATNAVAEVIIETRSLAFQAPIAGLFRIELPKSAGQSWIIQRSSNLVDWLPLQTNTFPGGASFIDIPTSDALQQFFRAQALGLSSTP